MKYYRKPEVVEAEQVDLRDPVQMSRLLISAYQGPLGLEASVQIDPIIRVGIKTGDWLVQPVGTDDPYKRVMSDADFKSLYVPVQVPSEVEFPPGFYEAIRNRRNEGNADGTCTRCGERPATSGDLCSGCANEFDLEAKKPD